MLLASSAAIARPASTPVEQGRDLTVAGRLKNLHYELVTSEDDLLGQGWITADLRVVRTLDGIAPSRVLRVRYFAHNYLREDKRFRFLLRRQEDGSYLICMPAGSIGVQCN